MGIKHFLYRQKSRWDYHTAATETERIVAEINRNELRVEHRKGTYYIPEADIEIPQGFVDHIFVRFDLFIENMVNLKGRYSWDDERLFFEFAGLKLQILSASELFIIDEIFFQGCYDFRFQEPCSVIDIGMNVGIASLFFAQNAFVREVYAFEPFADSFDQATANLSCNPGFSPKVRPFNYGLGKGERHQKLLFDPLASGTSGLTLAGTDDIAMRVREESVLIQDAHRVISHIIQSSPDLAFILKMDCEGAEYEIMDSLFENGFPSAIKGVLMEWHGENRAGDLQTKLLGARFRMVTTRLKQNRGLIYAFR